MRPVPIVRYTRSIWGRQHEPPRNDTVLSCMRTSVDIHCMSTAGCIPTSLKCLFIALQAKSLVEVLLALDQAIATGPMHPTTGVVSAKNGHQPLVQPVHDERYSNIPVFCVGTIYLIPLSVIEGVLHRLPLTPQPDCTWWYLLIMIALNACNLLYI